MDACTNPEILRVISFFLTIIDIIKIILPIVLIIFGIIDFSKAVIINDEKIQKKTINLFIKRLVYAIIIFAVPWIVEVAMEALGDLTAEVNYIDCIKNSKNINYFEQLEQITEEQESNKNQKENKEKILNNNENNSITSNEIANDSNDGSFIGQKYNLTEKQLKSIAMLCQYEQGSAKGAASEASLMANRFELFGTKYGNREDGLYNYVRNSKWWANAKNHMDNTKNLKDSILTAVYEVLVLGKRTLPLYIDEHDCIDCGKYGFDIIKIVINDQSITNSSELLNKDNYKQDETIIHNKYGAVYTFHSFPTNTSDPFGYTKTAKNKYNSLNK